MRPLGDPPPDLLFFVMLFSLIIPLIAGYLIPKKTPNPSNSQKKAKRSKKSEKNTSKIPNFSNPKIESISGNNVKLRMECKDNQLVLIDTRPAGKFNKIRIKGAINVTTNTEAMQFHMNKGNMGLFPVIYGEGDFDNCYRLAELLLSHSWPQKPSFEKIYVLDCNLNEYRENGGEVEETICNTALRDCLVSVFNQLTPKELVLVSYSPTVEKGIQTTGTIKTRDNESQTYKVDFYDGPLILHPEMFHPLLRILSLIDAETAMNLALTCREFYNLIVTRKNLKFPYLVHVLVELPANGVAKFKFLTHDERKAQKKRSNLPSWDDDYEKYDYIGREKYSSDSANAIYRNINCDTVVKSLVISEGYDRTFSDGNYNQMMQYLTAMGVKSVESLFIDLSLDCWQLMDGFFKEYVTVLVKSEFHVPAFVVQTIFQLPLSTVDIPNIPFDLFLETPIPSVERAHLSSQEQLSRVLEKATTSSTFKFFAVDTSFWPLENPFFSDVLPFDAPGPLPLTRPLLFEAADEEDEEAHFVLLRADGKVVFINDEHHFMNALCKEIREVEERRLPDALREI